MTIISMKELRTNTEEITRRVQAGESFTVVKRSKPIFNVVPTATSPDLAATKEWANGFVAKHQAGFDELADK